MWRIGTPQGFGDTSGLRRLNGFRRGCNVPLGASGITDAMATAQAGATSLVEATLIALIFGAYDNYDEFTVQRIEHKSNLGQLRTSLPRFGRIRATFGEIGAKESRNRAEVEFAQIRSASAKQCRKPSRIQSKSPRVGRIRAKLGKRIKNKRPEIATNSVESGPRLVEDSPDLAEPDPELVELKQSSAGTGPASVAVDPMGCDSWSRWWTAGGPDPRGALHARGGGAVPVQHAAQAEAELRADHLHVGADGRIRRRDDAPHRVAE